MSLGQTLMKYRRKNFDAVMRVWEKFQYAGWDRSRLAKALRVGKGQVTKFLSVDTVRHDLKLFEKFAAVASRVLKKKKYCAEDFFQSVVSWDSYDQSKAIMLRHRIDSEQTVIRGAQNKLSPNARYLLEKELSPQFKKWRELNVEARDGLRNASIGEGRVEKLFVQGNDIDDWIHTTLAHRVDRVLAENYRSLHFRIGDAADSHFIAQFIKAHRPFSKNGARGSEVFAAYQGCKTQLCAKIIDALIFGTPLDSDEIIHAVTLHVEIFRNPATTLAEVEADAILGPYLETLRNDGTPSAKLSS